MAASTQLCRFFRAVLKAPHSRSENDSENLCLRYSARIVPPKHPIGRFGFRAVVIGSEGNRLALHSD
jgi:hypothetical protein